MIQLETYKGAKTRHTCPACHHKSEFTRFVDDDGSYIADNVGICNRASKCGYRYTAKEFFRDNPSPKNKLFIKPSFPSPSSFVPINTQKQERKSFVVIPFEHLKSTLNSSDRNAFVQFLLNLFPDCAEEIQTVLLMYFVGTFEDYTCFPSIDRQNRICRAKLIRFNPETGKRLKGKFDTSSLVRKLKLKEDFQYKQIFFGEHLLSKYPEKPIAIVESEKSAIIGSLCLPENLWLATGSKQWLKLERLKRLRERQIILYPDADGFSLWQEIASHAIGQGMMVKVSSLIENFATAEQKADGYDLADYLISEQREINEINKYSDDYNLQLETVLNDKTLRSEFETILDEQKAVMIIDGNLSETEAEKLLSDSANIRRIVTSLIL